MADIVQAKILSGSEQDFLISEYPPRRVFPFSEEGPGGVIFSSNPPTLFSRLVNIPFFL